MTYVLFREIPDEFHVYRTDDPELSKTLRRFHGYFVNSVNCPDDISDEICVAFYGGDGATRDSRLELVPTDKPFQIDGEVVVTGMLL